MTFFQALDTLVAEHELVIDRPAGSVHPRFESFIYPLDYGCLRGTSSADGGGIDVWRGTAAGAGVVAVEVIVDLLKRDSEIKILLDCTEDEIAMIDRIHNETASMKGMLVRRP